MPPALLFVALGLALAFAPRRSTWLFGLVSLLVTLAALTFVPVPRAWLEFVFLACWISVIVAAASVHLKRELTPRIAVSLSINTGVWASAVVSLSGAPLDLIKALPCILIAIPGSWMVARHASVAVKVVSSWVIAIAVLAAVLQLLPVTPGYLPDHLE